MTNLQLVDNDDKDRTAVIQAARAALHLARRGEWPVAYDTVQWCADRYPLYVPLMLTVWIDTYTDHACDGQPASRATQSGVFDQQTPPPNIPDMPDGIPPRLAWAGQVIVARARMDRPTFMRLIDDAPTDQREYGRYVTTVLEACAAAIERTERGFALLELT